VPSLTLAAAAEARRAAVLALTGFGAFYATAAWALLRSNLTMAGTWW
jgi:hypothetical protein